MGACYAPDVRFSDPVFPDLRGDDARAMWLMLTARAKEFRVEYREVRSDGSTGSGHLEAWYRFSATGRPVHNIIEGSFTFRDGLIATHTDRFDLYRWTRQALGPVGLLLGWTSLVEGKVRRQAAEGLARWQAPVLGPPRSRP